MPCSVIALGNLKGGVGKTTLAVNIASALAADGAVVLVDADEQGTATHWAKQGLLPIAVRPLPCPSDHPKEASAWLREVVALKAETIAVVIDLPPNLGSVSMAALSIADLFVVPVTPSGMDLQATDRALGLMRQARQARGGDRPACLLVLSKVDRRTASGREIEAVLSDFREPVAPAVVQRAAHVDAFTAGQWIGAYAPRTAAHTEVEGLVALIKRIIRR